jgi:hydrogenase-4 component F
MNVLLQIIALPAVLAVLSYFIKSTGVTRKLVPAVLWVQLGVVTFLLLPVLRGEVPVMSFAAGLLVDKLGAHFMLLTSFVVACCTTHADYFFTVHEKTEPIPPHHLRIFYACVNIFLMAMTMVFVCDSLGYLWIAIEATTLSSAPLVYFERNKNALEATWKYLIVCSVGIAFALLGTVFIFAASQRGMAVPSLNFSDLVAHATALNFPLLQLGFIFCLLGYGTKAGIFPLHSWLPDAHSEAPAPASAMLSGSLLNCALFGIWKTSSLLLAAQPHSHTYHLVAMIGTVTVVAASLLLMRQHNFKRLWAYSSIENVGLMLFAIGFGSGALFFLQALNHSLAKVSLFLLTGNIVQAAGTKKLSKLHGVMEDSPLWAGLLALSAFAVAGAPPFGAFVAEMSMLTLSFADERVYLAFFMLIALAISFIAICAHVGGVIFGASKQSFKAWRPNRASIIPAMLVLCTLFLGLTLRTELWTIPPKADLVQSSLDHQALNTSDVFSTGQIR